MDKHLYYGYLFDCYGKLLTPKQQDYFQLYYFDNLTLSEISQNDGVSRSAVHKSLKEAIDKLGYYEEQLQFLAKKKAILDLVDSKLAQKIEDIYNS